MIPDLDIYRSANVLVKHHGQDAPIHAAMRADAMLEAGRPDFRFLVCFLPSQTPSEDRTRALTAPPEPISIGYARDHTRGDSARA